MPYATSTLNDNVQKLKRDLFMTKVKAVLIAAAILTGSSFVGTMSGKAVFQGAETVIENRALIMETQDYLRNKELTKKFNQLAIERQDDKK